MKEELFEIFLHQFLLLKSIYHNSILFHQFTNPEILLKKTITSECEQRVYKLIEILQKEQQIKIEIGETNTHLFVTISIIVNGNSIEWVEFKKQFVEFDEIWLNILRFSYECHSHLLSK